MMKVFVIMKQRYSPVAITSAKPHEVFRSSVGAKMRVKELNKKAQSNHFWVVSVDMEIGEPRLVEIDKKFYCADERGKELMFRQALALPCAKVPA